MEIHSVQEYINTIEKLKQNYTYSFPLYDGLHTDKRQTYVPRFVYRGHGNHGEYKLLPGVYREGTRKNTTIPTDYSLMEYNILSDFISESCRYISGIPKEDAVSWLEIAQHFGVPTRVLDFTQNPLVALYFACSKLQKTQASVWVINEPVYNRLFFGELPFVHAVNSQKYISKIVNEEIINYDGFRQDINLDIQYPRIYKPFYFEERMTSQASAFMMWGSDHRDFEAFLEPKHFMSASDKIENEREGIICSILIPSNKKTEILNQLDLCGINEKFIFPGIDGIGKYISRKYENLPF